MSQNKNDIVLYTKRGEIQIINENKKTETKTERDNIAINNNKKNKKLIIISIIIGIIVVGFSIFYFTRKNVLEFHQFFQMVPMEI